MRQITSVRPRRLLIAGALALTLAFPALRPGPAHAHGVSLPARHGVATRPNAHTHAAGAALTTLLAAPAGLAALAASVPITLQPPAGNVVFLVAHGAGLQIYTCAASGASFAWSSAVPAATLFTYAGNPIGTHFAGPTWQANDGSTVVGHKLQSDSVVPDAIPWLLLNATATTVGPGGGATLSETTYIQRLLTRGGLAPDASACNAGTVGSVASIPYTALYVFYQAAGLTLSTPLVHVGQSITVTGTAFQPSEPVQVSWDVTGTTPLATGTADATGQFVTTISIPAGADPLHTLLANGQSSGHSTFAYLVVVPGTARR